MKPISPYPGDAAMRRLLGRYNCPAPFHVVRMRLWGAIASPLPEVSPARIIEGLWTGGLPTFKDASEADRFFHSLIGLWNHMARFQSGSPPLRLMRVSRFETRELLHSAAKQRVEELYDGFMRGFTDGQEAMDVPSGVGDLLGQVERTIEFFAKVRNTFARPPGLDDEAMRAELARVFVQLDQLVQKDLNLIALTVRRWRSGRPSGVPDSPALRRILH
jgi:hypothetical protein